MIQFYNSKYQKVEVPKGAEIKWRVSDYAYVTNDEGKILMIKAIDSGLWELPGGKVEIGETLFYPFLKAKCNSGL